MIDRSWRHEGIDIGSLRASGWRPTPLREFVFKVAQRCNLACDYCYVYTKADQSWRDRPALMSAAVWQAAAERIAEHVERHGLSAVRVVLHGGEPLLAGVRTLAAIAHAVRSAVRPGCAVRVTMQTNAVLLTRDVLATLREAGIVVGVSIDGSGSVGSRHRRHADGRPSFDAVDRALKLLAEPENVDVYAGVICVVDAEADPLECYEGLLGYRPPFIDFLLPHANWMSPPSNGPGNWLIKVFDRWYDAPRQETRIRMFEDVIRLVFGAAGRSEHLGLSPVAVAVIESDGAIEQADSLKSAYPGAPATGLSVLEHPFDLALRHPGFVARQAGVAALSPSCLSCGVHRVCGGGHYAHRFHARNGFRNRSVYCADLYKLITHVARRLSADTRFLPGRLRDS
jgi:uncharacterized protein